MYCVLTPACSNRSRIILACGSRPRQPTTSAAIPCLLKPMATLAAQPPAFVGIIQRDQRALWGKFIERTTKRIGDEDASAPNFDCCHRFCAGLLTVEVI